MTKHALLLLLLLTETLLASAQVSVYPYPVDPARFPDYERRPFRAPTASAPFKDTVRFVAERYVDPKRANMFYGDFYRPNQGWAISQSYFDVYADILSMAKEKVGLFDMAGYGPGTPYNGSFGQKSIPSNRLEMMDKLGDLYVGNSLGEQDGRFWADQRQLMEPYSRDARVQHKVFLDYMRWNARDYGYKLTQLTTFWGNHYLPKDGYVSMVGTECQNKDRVAQMQVQYAFNRGVSRQYGLLNFGDVSVYNTWGYKGNPSDSTAGNSFALMRRMMLLEFQYGSWILGFESGWGTKAAPQPIGKIQKGLFDLVNQRLPRPGTFHPGAAYLTDFFSGWMPPYQNTYYRWGFLPYGKGQYLTHYLLDLTYPNYATNGKYTDESTAISANPYGDVDVLLSDISEELLLQYPLVVVADELNTDLREVADVLDAYVREGGQLVLTAGNAVKWFPKGSFSGFETVAAGTSVQYNGKTFSEPYAFQLCTSNLPGQEVLATAGGKPVAVRYASGKGSYTILLTEFGLSNATGQPALLQQTRQMIANLLGSRQLFTAGDKLTCSTNILNDTTFIVGVYNNTLSQQIFTLQSKIGTIAVKEELPLGEDISSATGYKPTGTTVVYGSNSDITIRSLDARLYRITVRQPNIAAQPEIAYPSRPSDKYLAVGNILKVKDLISSYPHFFRHFSGVKLDWTALGNTDLKSFTEAVVWMNHQKLDLVVDLSETFPLADYRPENPIEFYELNLHLTDLTNNLKVFTGKKTLVLPAARNQLEVLASAELLRICSTMASGVLVKNQRGPGGARTYDGTSNSLSGTELTYLEPRKEEIDVKSLQSTYQNIPVVFNLSYVQWDSIYAVLDSVATGKSLHTPVSGKAVECDWTVPVGNQFRYVALHDIRSIHAAILEHQDDFRTTFGGVKVDGSCLWNMSEQACKEEGRWLKARNIGLVVDLVREINHYPDLTWVKDLETYSKSKAFTDNVLAKMQLMGCTNVIIGSHMRCELWSNSSYTNETAIRTGMKAFIDAAAAKGITVHIQHREYQNYPNKLLASPSQTMTLVNDYAGTRFAACFGLYSDATYLKNLAKDKLGIVLLSYKGNASLDCRNPLYLGTYTQSKPDLSLLASASVPLVLDAEYTDWSEVMKDGIYLGWAH